MSKDIAEYSRRNIYFETRKYFEEIVLQNGFGEVYVEECSITTIVKSLDDMFASVAASLHIYDFNTMMEKLKDVAQKNDLSLLYNAKGIIDINIPIFKVRCKKH